MAKSLHPVIERAAKGDLPAWAVVTPTRKRHMKRVAELMRQWAEQLDLPPREVKRWAAAGILHDILRDEDPELLRPEVPKELRKLYGSLLHGPAAAARLRSEGVEDEPLLLAVAFHTLGHPDMDRLGICLCAADFLEPGRSSLFKLRKKLRKRMPGKHKKVVRRIFRLRIATNLRANRSMSPYTIGLWNRLSRG